MRRSKNRVRLSALLLALTILLAALPLTAFAEEETYVFDEIRDYLIQDTHVADDGETIPSNVQAAYHSMGDGSKNYKKWLTDEVCPSLVLVM